MKGVAIIGGGITGLTAAYRLREAGHRVSLFESADRAGGVIRTVRHEGFLAECGPNTILETSPLIGELIADLGLSGRRMDSNPEAEARYILKGGKPVEMEASPAGFLGSPLFSWRAKLRLAKEPFVRRAPAEVEESLAEFVVRRLGQEFLDYAINPFVAGVYAGDPARLSVREAFPKLHALEQRYGSLILGQILGARERARKGTVSKDRAKKVSFDEGLQVLTDALADSLGESLHLKRPVTGIEKGASGVRVLGAGVGEKFDAVLLALPGYRLAEFELTGERRFDLSPLAEIYYPPVASVVLGFRREEVAHALKGFGTLNPELEKRKTLGTIFSSSLFPGRAPEGQVLLTSYVGGTRAPELAAGSPEEITAAVLEDLRGIYGVTGEPTFRHVFVYPKAIPQYETGFGKYRELMARCEQEVRGVFLAGHCRDGISLGDSIVSGHTVADRIGTHLMNPARPRR